MWLILLGPVILFLESIDTDRRFQILTTATGGRILLEKNTPADGPVVLKLKPAQFIAGPGMLELKLKPAQFMAGPVKLKPAKGK